MTKKYPVLTNDIEITIDYLYIIGTDKLKFKMVCLKQIFDVKKIVASASSS